MKSLRLPVLVAASGLLPSLFAQINYDDIPIEYRPVRKNAFSVGMRIIGGADVKFGNLGTIPSTLAVDPADPSAGAVTRLYADGTVLLDAPRSNEIDSNGNQTSTPGGRYYSESQRVNEDGTLMVDADGNPVMQRSGDYLAYTPGITRAWSYSSDAQAASNPGYIAMHNYTTQSLGGTAEASSGAGAGFEFTASHRFGTFGSSRIEWGILAGVGITDINGKTSSSVRANLTTLTDLYRITNALGAAPGAPYSSPTFSDYVGEDGAAYSNGTETTTTLSGTPSSRTITTTPNGAQIDGHWQIKGAYYLFRVGPVIRIPIGSRFAATLSAGYAAAYLGTTYKVEETLAVEGITPITYRGEEDYTDFLHGTYGEVNVEWWLTSRTGFFAGATYEGLGDYKQTMGDRTASIEIGGNTGFRFGLTTRF